MCCTKSPSLGQAFCHVAARRQQQCVGERTQVRGCACVCALPGRAAQALFHPGALLTGVQPRESPGRVTAGSRAMLCGSVGCSACSALAVRAGSHHPATLGSSPPLPGKEAVWAGRWGRRVDMYGGDKEWDCLARPSVGCRVAALPAPAAGRQILLPPTASSALGGKPDLKHRPPQRCLRAGPHLRRWFNRDRKKNPNNPPQFWT